MEFSIDEINSQRGERDAWIALLAMHIMLSILVFVASLLIEEEWMLQPQGGFYLGQIAILAIWLSLGPARLRIKLAIFYALGLAAAALELAPTSGSWQVLLVAMVPQTMIGVAVLLPLYGARRQGWRTGYVFYTGNESEQLRISIAMMLVLTLLTAFLTQAYRYVHSLGKPGPDGTLQFPGDIANLVVPIILGWSLLCLGVAVCSAVRFCLASDIQASQFMLTLALFVVLAVFAFPFQFGSSGHITWAVFIAVMSLTTVGSLLVLRMYGLRYFKVW